MSRFENLEFDDEKEAQPAQGRPRKGRQAAPPATGTPIRDAPYFLAQGDNDFRIGNVEAALRSYSRALEQDNTLSDGWVGQVRTLLETGEFKEADLWADKALELFPEHPELLAAKAVASLRMGKRKLALAQSDNAISGKGLTPYAWLARGETLLAARRRLADHCLNQALASCSGQRQKAWTHWELARLLRHYGRARQALKHAQAAAEELPEEPGAWLELGRCQLDLKMPAAKQSLEEAVHLSEECVAAQRMLRHYRGPGFLRRLIFFWRKG